MPQAGDSDIRFDAPPTFDELGFAGALVRYDVELPAMAQPAVLEFDGVRDLAWVRVDGRTAARLGRGRNERAAVVPPGRALTVIVEDQGRVNYAGRIGEAKGLVGRVRLAGEPLTGWQITTVDLESIAGEVAERGVAAEASSGPAVGPVALVADFDLEERADLFLDTTGLAKGFAFVNGFHLGRYWSAGPQRTLFVPAPVTKAGSNRLVILELEHAVARAARFVAEPDLGHDEE